MKRLLYFLLIANSVWLTACSVNKQITKQAQQVFFSDSNFTPAHLGISIYDPGTNKYLYNYQSDKYFIPASNTKLLTCYAAMKYLGDSLVGLRYQLPAEAASGDSTIVLAATGDPTFLHPDFKKHPVADFLMNNSRATFIFKKDFFQAAALGRGWAWDDYSSDYMAERSPLPVYGNLFHFEVKGDAVRKYPSGVAVEFKGFDMETRAYDNKVGNYSLHRDRNSNIVLQEPTSTKFTGAGIPFITSDFGETIKMIRDTLHLSRILPDPQGTFQPYLSTRTVYSQPTDSLLSIMMHRSDNFFAEQLLLMVSNEVLGYMSDIRVIDSLLQTDFKDIPQKPKWVDGSGLSRYNLITPQDFVWVLNKMKRDFTWERISTILPTGDEGTLKGYYKSYVGKIYAKTGGLSNNTALSGFITTKKGKQLIFSILVNNHQASATNIRRSVERFLINVIDSN